MDEARRVHYVVGERGAGLAEDLNIVVPHFDLRRSMTLQRLGRLDPTARHGEHQFDKVHDDGRGGVVHHRLQMEDGRLSIAVTGMGVEPWRRQFPLDDGYEGFVPAHPVLDAVAHHVPGLRLLRVPWLFDVVCGAILQQRVSFEEAAEGFRRVALAFGTPGPNGMTAFPGARRLAGLPLHELQALGIDPQRGRRLLTVAKEEVFRSFLGPDEPADTARARLRRLPGIGPWTDGMVAGFGLGDPDAVPVGDLHLPGLVTRALTGREARSDERMLEALEPYRGQRFRVIRLLLMASFRAPGLLRP